MSMIPSADTYESALPGALADAEAVGRVMAEIDFEREGDCTPYVIDLHDGTRGPRIWLRAADGHLGEPAMQADAALGYDLAEQRGNAAYGKRWDELVAETCAAEGS